MHTQHLLRKGPVRLSPPELGVARQPDTLFDADGTLDTRTPYSVRIANACRRSGVGACHDEWP